MNVTRPRESGSAGDYRPRSRPTGILIDQEPSDLPRLGRELSPAEHERIVLPKASRPLSPAHVELLKLIAAHIVDDHLDEVNG